MSKKSNEGALFAVAHTELQEIWEEKSGVFAELAADIGIRSTQICAVLLYLIRIGVINRDNVAPRAENREDAK